MNWARSHNGSRPDCGGSALIIAMWTITLLSMLVMSFALDALLEGKINVYVKQRRHVDYLTQSGTAIAEMLLLDFPNASPSSSSAGRASTSTRGATVSAASPASGSDEDDKWLQYKLDLQRGSAKVDKWPIIVDKPELGVVTVEITSADANKWPINLLVKSDIADRVWENVLNVIGLPMEYQEEVVDSWYDWVDEDRTVTGRNGAEDEYYNGLDLKGTMKGKNLKMPRNGPVSSVAELKMIRGIREHPAIYDGGVLDPDEAKSRSATRTASRGTTTTRSTTTTRRRNEEQIVIQPGIKAFFDIYGEAVKINVNSAEMDVLMTVPGIDGDVELAGAIVEERKTGANRLVSSVDPEESLLFKDWGDLNGRIPGGLPMEAEQFLTYAPQKYFDIKVTGEAGGITHQIKAVAIVEGDKVRYLRWREDP